MSTRKDLKGKIFSDILVLEFHSQKNTHAQWKCLCMQCNSLVYVTATNLESGNTKSCTSCGQKKMNYLQQCEILDRLRSGESKTKIAKEFHVSREVIYRIIREHQPQEK